MTALALVCLWVIAAWALSLLPSRRRHWPLAYALIVAGLPVLAYVYWSQGVLPALISLVIGAMVLRWPVRYLWRWIVRNTGFGT